MHLTPREQEKLMIVVAADLARRRRQPHPFLAVSQLPIGILAGQGVGEHVGDQTQAAYHGFWPLALPTRQTAPDRADDAAADH